MLSVKSFVKGCVKNQVASAGEHGFMWICVLYPLIHLRSCSTLCLNWVPSLVDKRQSRLQLIWVKCAGRAAGCCFSGRAKCSSLSPVASLYFSQNLSGLPFLRTSIFCPQLSNLLKTGQQVQMLLRKDWQIYVQRDLVSFDFFRSQSKKQVCSVFTINPCL